MLGYNVEGCPEMAHRIAVKVLPNMDLLRTWSNLVRPIVIERFRQWAEQGQPLHLFDSITHLALTVILYILTGQEFASKHMDELVPMMQAYEPAVQQPQTKAFPRWASKAGRLLDSVENRVKYLLDDVLHIIFWVC